MKRKQSRLRIRIFYILLLAPTVLWLIFLGIWALMASNLYMIIQGSGRYPIWLPASILVAGILLVMIMIYTFAMLSRFDTTVFRTLSNAVSLTFSELPRSVEMMIITLVPLAAFFSVSILLPLLVLFGISVPGYACAMIYDPVFRRIERQMGEEELEGAEEAEEP